MKVKLLVLLVELVFVVVLVVVVLGIDVRAIEVQVVSVRGIIDRRRPIVAVRDDIVETRVIAIARRSGNTWYVGVLGNWDERDVELDLGFLPEGDYKAEIFRDGVNAGKVARDFKRVEETLPADRKLAAHLAPGGGYVAIITRE